MRMFSRARDRLRSLAAPSRVAGALRHEARVWAGGVQLVASPVRYLLGFLRPAASRRHQATRPAVDDRGRRDSDSPGARRRRTRIQNLSYGAVIIVIAGVAAAFVVTGALARRDADDAERDRVATAVAPTTMTAEAEQ